MRLLLVEDDDIIAQGVAIALTQAGFRVERASDGDTAWIMGNDEDYDVVVLDLGLPRRDGLSVLKRWREDGRQFPVIILSARGGWREKVEGIEAGADDYLAKPFEPGELIARVRALIRRNAGLAESVLVFGRLALDTRRMQASVDGTALSLSPLEYRLIDALAHSGGRPLSAGTISEMLHGVEAVEANAVEALVARLRRKLGPGIIETRRGFGYCLADGD
ncbi:putative two-component response regulator [Caenibius tardaugens NBRC 16725]|uniref:Putative two-component response regulator n=1 Tax=Caenibius tardaugens NBRC 16725 TaxID=1219035 RepID=U2YHA0_9SPHN|nr:response regulator transcription factor [Caenibius tardaugens]AZI37288.1 DNA-binding response regulator [Caenibius tardaugens NBRC 16725]GAD47460.1 putative two-component response regulator [Caenibius tardaugens NBRC 16725]